jgi:hypothetical protein
MVRSSSPVISGLVHSIGTDGTKTYYNGLRDICQGMIKKAVSDEQRDHGLRF